jgi:L-threonylcarbamoyladenylate synthase
MKIINEKDHNSVDLAIEFLQEGKVICFATDTVYGVAVDATNYEAVDRLYQLKNREKNKPLAIFVKDKKSAQKLFIINQKASYLIDKYMPGPITIILSTNNFAKKYLAKNLNNEHNESIGFRIVDTYFIRNLFKKFDGILAVSSANKAFEDACFSANMVKNNLRDLDLLVVGRRTSKMASTIVKMVDDKISIIRQGKLIIEET